MTLLPQQALAARAGLGLSRDALARRSKISAHTIMKFEVGDGKPHPATVLALKLALDAEGVVFLPDGGVLLPGKVLASRRAEGVIMPSA